MPAPTEMKNEARPVFRRRERRRGVPLLLVLLLILAVGVGGFFARDLLTAYFPQVMARPSVMALLGKAPDEVIPIGADAVVSVWEVEEIVRPASELITVRYAYTDADVFENYKQIRGLKIPLTTNKTIFTYDGVISVGIDFAQIGIEVDNDARLITLSLPAPTVLANEIDASSFQYYDVSSSVFNQTGMGDVTELVKELKAKKADKVLADAALLEQATESAETVLKGFLSASDLTKDYSIAFSHAQ